MSTPPAQEPPTQEPSADWELTPATDLEIPFSEVFRSLKREPGLFSSMVGLAFWSAVRGYLRVGHRLRIEGRSNLPNAAPFVLVANHTSHLDALTLGCVLRSGLRCRTYPMAAGDTFFQRPQMAAFAALVLNALPMWRDSSGTHGLRQLRERVWHEPCGLILFPEGTRSRTGQLGRFKPGLGMLVCGRRLPVVPCHLQGAFESLPVGRRVPRLRKISLRVGEPLWFDAVENNRPGWGLVAERVRAAVADLAF